MRAHPARLGALTAIAAVGILAAALPARADTASPPNSVTRWNGYAASATFGGGQGSPGVANVAIVQGAVYDAVNAIDRRARPYLGAPHAKRWYSQDAAVVAAAYGVLVGSQKPVVPDAQLPALKATLKPLYDADLAALPDGPAKQGGIATGEAAAAAMIAARTDDGRFGEAGFDLTLIPPGPGVWAGLPVNDPNAWLRNVRPFMIPSASMFRTRGPRALTGARYAAEFAEVKDLGSVGSTTRSDEQTSAAKFWGTSNAVGTWSALLRDIAGRQHLSTSDSARFYAMAYLTGADALIAAWDDKQHYLFWRPIQAIREADTDGNPDTEADSAWTPLIPTPPYPDHPSGLSSVGGAYVATLQEFFGTDRVAFGTTTVPGGVTRSYTRLSQAIEDIVDARVWSGIHFRTADNQGARLGRRVARWRSDHGLLRLHGRGGREVD
jgi:hypothetical protein